MKDSKSTRRSFLSGALAAGAAALVAACGGTPTPAPEPTKAAEPPKAAAQPTATTAAQPAAASKPTEAAKPTEAPKPTAAPAQAAAPTTAPAAASKPAAAKPATVRWWMTARGDDLEAFKVAPNSYAQKNPGITFDIGSIADTGLTKVQTAIAAGDAPELVLTWDRAGTAGIYYKGGVLVLDDYLKDKDFDAKALVPMSLEGLKSHDGKQFAIPNQIYVVSHLWYNPKMFQDKGVAKPPETLDELRKVAAMFDVKKGNDITAVGFHPTAYLNNQAYAFAYGGKFFDATGGKVTPDDPGVVAGLEYLVKWYHDYGVDTLRRLMAGYGQYQSAQNAFLAEQVAMTGFWDALAAYHARYAPQVPMDHAWFPYAADKPEAKGFGMVNFNPNFVCKDAKERDIAVDVNKFVAMDADSALQMAILLANTPQNLKALDLPAASKADPLLRKAWNYAAKGQLQYFPPSMPGMAEYSQEWGRQLDLMLAEKVSVKDGVQAIKTTVQPVVDKTLKGG